MLQDIIAVKPLPGYKLHLRFEDGVEGVVELKQIIEFTGVFEPLEEYDYFAQVRVNPELGTVQWPNEADLDPDVLYATVTEQPITNDEQEGVSSQRLASLGDSLESLSDIVQIRVDYSNILDGSIPITDGINILESARSMLLSAALSTIEPRTYFRGRQFSEAVEYINKVRVGQTQKGSYIFNVISPLNQLIENQEEQSSYQLFTEPFERQVIKTLFQALATIKTASEQALNTDDLEDLSSTVQKGVSANLCQSLLVMINSSGGQGLNFYFRGSSRLEIPADIPREITIPTEATPVIRNVSQKLKRKKIFLERGRQAKPIASEIVQSIQPQFYLSGFLRIEGPVVRLEWVGGDEKAKVTVVSLIEDEEKEVIVELDRAEYLIAIRANLEQRSVICYGNLVQENDSLLLRKPRNFSMASER